MKHTEFALMFPEAPSSGMTVLTVTQRTENDMTAWSEEVDQEREQLLAKVSHTNTLILQHFSWLKEALHETLYPVQTLT